MFMLSLIFVLVCGVVFFSRSKSVHIFYCLFISVLSLEIQSSRVRISGVVDHHCLNFLLQISRKILIFCVFFYHICLFTGDWFLPISLSIDFLGQWFEMRQEIVHFKSLFQTNRLILSFFHASVHLFMTSFVL